MSMKTRIFYCGVFFNIWSSPCLDGIKIEFSHFMGMELRLSTCLGFGSIKESRRKCEGSGFFDNLARIIQYLRFAGKSPTQRTDIMRGLRPEDVRSVKMCSQSWHNVIHVDLEKLIQKINIHRSHYVCVNVYVLQVLVGAKESKREPSWLMGLGIVFDKSCDQS